MSCFTRGGVENIVLYPSFWCYIRKLYCALLRRKTFKMCSCATSTLFPNFWRYILRKLRSSREDAEVQNFALFLIFFRLYNWSNLRLFPKKIQSVKWYPLHSFKRFWLRKSVLQNYKVSFWGFRNYAAFSGKKSICFSKLFFLMFRVFFRCTTFLEKNQFNQRVSLEFHKCFRLEKKAFRHAPFLAL